MNTDQQDRQRSLFPDTDVAVVFEQPLNERMRSCLRLEHLFSGIEVCIESGGEWHARDALTRMLEVCDFLTRTDVKGELIKELERSTSLLAALKSNPGVDLKTLDRTLDALNNCLVDIKTPSYQPGSVLRNSELANVVKQRISIPGGTCNFDVPAFHFWLSGSDKARNHQLLAWMKDLRSIQTATTLILRITRDSAVPKMVTASSGFYQQQLDPAQQTQLVRVVLPSEGTYYPEISGGKHRFSVRFYEQPVASDRPAQVDADVRFELQCCGV